MKCEVVRCDRCDVALQTSSVVGNCSRDWMMVEKLEVKVKEKIENKE